MWGYPVLLFLLKLPPPARPGTTCTRIIMYNQYYHILSYIITHTHILQLPWLLAMQVQINSQAVAHFEKDCKNWITAEEQGTVFSCIFFLTFHGFWFKRTHRTLQFGFWHMASSTVRSSAFSRLFQCIRLHQYIFFVASWLDCSGFIVQGRVFEPKHGILKAGMVQA